MNPSWWNHHQTQISRADAGLVMPLLGMAVAIYITYWLFDVAHRLAGISRREGRIERCICCTIALVSLLWHIWR